MKDVRFGQNDETSTHWDQPNGGVTFTGSGTYGSGFDELPSGGVFLLILCDDCMHNSINDGLIAVQETQKRITSSIKIATQDNILYHNK